jgi:hypothetical protein
MDTIEVVSYLVYLAQDWLKATLFEMSEKLLNSTKCETTLPQTSMIFQNAIKKWQIIVNSIYIYTYIHIHIYIYDHIYPFLGIFDDYLQCLFNIDMETHGFPPRCGEECGGLRRLRGCRGGPRWPLARAADMENFHDGLCMRQ